MIYMHFPTGKRFRSAQELRNVAVRDDFELAFDIGICPISLYLYYRHLKFYTTNPYSVKKNTKLNSKDDWFVCCQLVEKAARHAGCINFDVRAAYASQHTAWGKWPRMMDFMRAYMSPL